jgi:hypothetical protein
MLAHRIRAAPELADSWALLGTEWRTAETRNSRGIAASAHGAALEENADEEIRMRLHSPFTILGLAVLFAGCGSSVSSTSSAPGPGIGDGVIGGSGGGGESGATPGVGAPASDGAGGSMGAGTSTGSESSSTGTGAVTAGVLTAGTWDDNQNFDLFLAYLASSTTLAGAPPITEAEHRSANATWTQPRAARTKLDVSLVLDTTGSMGDELSYLSSEFLSIHAAIEAKYPDADQRWSLVVYKDVTDPYVVKWFDFRADPNDFVTNLKAQSADGGGDYAESPERALAVDAQLAWRGDDTAKLAFWITDAPHHDQNAPAMADAVRALRARGVHLYPVAASGADPLTELAMRQGAQLTGGRFLFLTDDSGVGGAHATPRVPCFFVTKLDAAIRRMVDIELSGQYREPTAAEVLRTGGDPSSGRCLLASGQSATVF